jgi:hypothetical protein
VFGNQKQGLIQMYPDDSIQGVLSPNPALPVAALPQYKKEVRAVYRAKKRPGLIVCSGGTKIDRILTAGKPKWQTSRTVIVAPYYGTDEGGKRSGFKPEFVKRIRRCEYSQYMWDLLPINGSTEESVMRLDHPQPVGRSEDSMELLDYCLSDDAFYFSMNGWNGFLRVFLKPILCSVNLEKS